MTTKTDQARAINQVPFEAGVTSRRETLLHLTSSEKALGAAYGNTGLRGVLKDRYALYCSFFAAMGGLLFGIDQGLMSITLVMPQFLDQFSEVDESVGKNAGFNKGLLTAILELGAIFGAFASSFVADRWSRRVAIRTGVTFFIIGSALQTGSFAYAMLAVGRFIGGIGIGFLSMIAPIYISECSPPNVRGVLLVLESFAIVTGVVIAYYFTFGTRHIVSDWSFRLPFLVQMVPGFIMLASSFVLPASPRWLAMRGRHDEGLRSLAKLRQRDAQDALVQAEWIEIRAEIGAFEEAQAGRHPKLAEASLKPETRSLGDEVKLAAFGWLDTLKPAYLHRTLIAIGLMFFQQLVGINALIYYSPTLFETLGLDYEARLNYSGIVNIMQLVGTTMSFFVIDRLGRKPLLLIGSTGMVIEMVVVSALTAQFSSDWPAHQSAAKAAIAMLCLYMVSYGISWNPIPWGAPAELFPSSMRAKGVAWSVMSNWFFNFIIGLIVPPMLQNIGYGTFIFFACFAFLSALFSVFVMKETRGVPLEAMDRLFDDDAGTRDAMCRDRIKRSLIDAMNQNVEIVASSSGGSDDGIQSVGQYGSNVGTKDLSGSTDAKDKEKVDDILKQD